MAAAANDHEPVPLFDALPDREGVLELAEYTCALRLLKTGQLPFADVVRHAPCPQCYVAALIVALDV